MKLLRAITTISGWTVVSRVMGLVREMLMAHILGASIVAEAFLVAFKFPNFFRRLFAEGALNSAFVPIFSEKLVNEGPEAAKLSAERVMSLLATILFVFVALVLIFTPQLMPLLAPGFGATPERLQLAIDFTRITFPYIFFMSLTALQTGVLNSLDRFAAGAAAPVLLNIVMISALAGYALFSMTPGYALSISVFVAGVLQFLWLYYASWRVGFRLKLHWPRLTPEVRRVLKLMIPGTIGAGVMQINLLVDMLLATLLPVGSLAYLHYADRLNQLPLSIFGIAIGTALLPKLSKLIQQKDFEGAQKTQESALELALQLSLPAAVGLVVLAHPLISLIYGHGVFGPDQVAATAPALAVFAVGLPAYVLNKVLTTNFFARQDTKTPVKVATFCVLMNIILSLILMGPFLHVGMAMATSLAAWIQSLLLVVLLMRRGEHLSTPALRQRLKRLLLSCSLMGAGLWFAEAQLDIGEGTLREIMQLGMLVLIGLALFISLGYFLKAYDVGQLRQMMRKS